MSNKKKVLLFLLVGCVAIQFYRPNINNQKQETLDDFLIAEKAPKQVRALIKNSCYDCHSNQTNYLWFDNIAPVAWYVDNHIKDAKEHLNFSNWAGLESRDKAGRISEIAVNIVESKMPLPAYLKLHSGARLNETQKQVILNWLYTIE
jgi:prepilin-type processing-associated H-X9-DG protein